VSPLISFPFLKRQSDARLVALARAGNDRAFETLVERHRPALLAYARRLLGADAHAEDALQQALLQAWVALRAEAEPLDVKAWLFRIVHNASINVMRRRQLKCVELNEAIDTAGAGDADVQIEAKEALAQMAALPELQRRAIVLTAFWGRTHEEAAATLGVSGGAVRGLIHRARTSLRRAAAALLPAPVAAWAAARSGSRAEVPERIGELAAGAGSAGAGGMLLKGGAIAVSAGVLVTAVHGGVPKLFMAGPHHGSAGAVAGVAYASRGDTTAPAGADPAPATASPTDATAATAAGVHFVAARSAPGEVAHATSRYGGPRTAAGVTVFASHHVSGRRPGESSPRSGPGGGRISAPQGGSSGGSDPSTGSGGGHGQSSGLDDGGAGSGGDGAGGSSSVGSGHDGASPGGSGTIGGVSGSDGGGATSGGPGGSDDATATSSGDGGSVPGTYSSSDSRDSGHGSWSNGSSGTGTSDGGSASTSSTASTSGPASTSTSASTTTPSSGSTSGSGSPDG
jgi:RNA polymerase sigma factor (sigma-70 family)